MKCFRGDATVVAHFMEFCAKKICRYNYDENGNTRGKVELIPKYERLRWSITPELNVIWPVILAYLSFVYYY